MDYKDLNFKKVIGVLLIAEGGYSNDPLDYGGETNFGISKRSYPDLDIKNLSIESATEIYYQDFWLKYKLNSITSSVISCHILLMVVNLSPTSAIKCIQRAINLVKPSVEEDGILGTQTTLSLNNLPECHLIDHIRIELIKFYLNRVKINKNQSKYLEGWIRRALL